MRLADYLFAFPPSSVPSTTGRDRGTAPIGVLSLGLTFAVSPEPIELRRDILAG
jgi:hypothetical protein